MIAQVNPAYYDAGGKLRYAGAVGSGFTLTARADRIDLADDGAVVIPKDLVDFVAAEGEEHEADDVPRKAQHAERHRRRPLSTYPVLRLTAADAWLPTM